MIGMLAEAFGAWADLLESRPPYREDYYFITSSSILCGRWSTGHSEGPD